MQPTGEWLNQPGGLAERLTLMRKTAGLTQETLAGRLSWPRSKVVKLENGRQMPSPADLREWADACGQPGTVRTSWDCLRERRPFTGSGSISSVQVTPHCKLVSTPWSGAAPASGTSRRSSYPASCKPRTMPGAGRWKAYVSTAPTRARLRTP
jgi:transcriptional regulator with XRE-family HTH domain